MSVYYVGCYSPDAPSDLISYVTNGPFMTVEYCVGICLSLEFNYSGLQHKQYIFTLYFYLSFDYKYRVCLKRVIKL